MSGKCLFPKQRNPHSRCVSKVSYQQHVPFHVYFSRQSFLFFSNTLLLILDKSIGSTGTRSIGGYRTQSHSLDSLLVIFFVQRIGLLKLLRFRSSSHSASREAHGKKLRPFKGLATSSSISLLLLCIPHSSSDQSTVFNAPLSFSSGLLHSLADTFHSSTRGKTCQKR